MDCFRRACIESEKPLVKEAYEVLGADKVREMKYHQSNIKRELTKRMHETLETKIFLLLDAQLPKQVAIPKANIKQKLQEIYDELEIKKKANASVIKKWYTVISIRSTCVFSKFNDNDSCTPAQIIMRNSIAIMNTKVYSLSYCGFWLYLFARENTLSMNTLPETFRQEYQSPALRIIPLIPENAICDSSIPGGNEDIGYEDWD